MKAIVFNETVDYDTQEVRTVILVPDNTPKLEEIERLLGEVIKKEINKKVIPALGDKVKFKNGNFTPAYFKVVDKLVKEKNYDIRNWILKKYKGKEIKFESNF